MTTLADNDVVIVDAVRTPIGKYGGALKTCVRTISALM